MPSSLPSSVSVAIVFQSTSPVSGVPRKLFPRGRTGWAPCRRERARTHPEAAWCLGCRAVRSIARTPPPLPHRARRIPRLPPLSLPTHPPPRHIPPRAHPSRARLGFLPNAPTLCWALHASRGGMASPFAAGGWACIRKDMGCAEALCPGITMWKLCNRSRFSPPHLHAGQDAAAARDICAHPYPGFSGRQMRGGLREAWQEGREAWRPPFGWASRDATDGGHPQQLP